MARDDRKPVGKRARFLKLARMSASVATNTAAGKVKGLFQDAETRAAEKARTDARSGQLIAETLGELKGAAMKVGQIASVARDLLPDDLMDALTPLQRDAPPMDYDVISGQIEKELGSPPELLFQRFDREPFAAASIGQVHRARTDDGREVVVKVQYPGVDESVDSDLAHLKLALRASGMVTTRKAALDEFFGELRDRMREETDYTNEAQNVRWFRALHADDPHIVIPEVVGERSSGRILTLTYEAGDRIDEMDALGYDQATRDLLGQRLAHMLYKQLFEVHAVHADPNPANFAFRKTGEIVMYDFGCIKVFPAEDARAYRDCMIAFRDRDDAGIQRGLETLGLQREGAKVSDQADIYAEARSSFGPLLFEDAVVDFGAAMGHQIFARVIAKGLKRPRQFQPAASILFTDRAQTGHYTNMKDMKARFNMHRIYRDYLALPQLGEEGFEARMRRVPVRPPV